MSEQLLARIERIGIVPVIAIEDAASALPLADALLEGGIDVIEITFRTTAAAEVVRIIASERPQMLVGAGTILTTDDAKIAWDAGATFALAPGCREAVVQAAHDHDLVFIPGVCTPSDVERALALGCQTLKFFPAEAMGGLATLSAIHAPYRHRGVRFVPTGGVNVSNLSAYAAHPAVAAVGGTWLARNDDIRDGRWDAVRQRAVEAIAILSQTRQERTN